MDRNKGCKDCKELDCFDCQIEERGKMGKWLFEKDGIWLIAMLITSGFALFVGWLLWGIAP